MEFDLRSATMSLSRRLMLSLGVLAGVSMLSSTAIAQGYPSKPITWIVPYTAGSPVDISMRRLAEAVGRALKGTIVVENRGGSSGVLGAAEVAKARPDGYTLLATIGDPLIGSTVLMKDVPYDPLTDFTFVTKLTNNFPVLVINSSKGLKTLRDMLEAGKTTTIRYGSYGPGSFPQVWMEDLSRAAGIKMQEVPYRATPETLQALTTGEVDMTFSNRGQAREMQQQGKAFALAIPGPGPSTLEGVPTYKEAGYDTPILTTPVWNGILGPKGLPQEVVDKTVAAVREAFSYEEIKTFYGANGSQLVANSPAEFEAEFRREYEAVVPLLKELSAQQ